MAKWKDRPQRERFLSFLNFLISIEDILDIEPQTRQYLGT